MRTRVEQKFYGTGNHVIKVTPPLGVMVRNTNRLVPPKAFQIFHEEEALEEFILELQRAKREFFTDEYKRTRDMKPEDPTLEEVLPYDGAQAIGPPPKEELTIEEFVKSLDPPEELEVDGEIKSLEVGMLETLEQMREEMGDGTDQE